MAHPPEPELLSEDFTVNDLPRLRSLVARAAMLAGLTARVIEDLVTAVNEIATNAIRYAGGRGRITISSFARGVSVEISDHGPGLPANLRAERPAPEATGGRGIWMARRLCERMAISSSPYGVTVRLVVLVP